MTVDGIPPIEFALYLGDKGTCNVAEYRALIAALQMAQELGVTDLTIRSDSKLIVEQVLGNWKVKNARLRSLHEEALAMAQRIEVSRIDHVSREANKLADSLCTKVLDNVTGRPRQAS
jgi:ribonuclease HI